MSSALVFALSILSTSLFAGQFDEEHLRIVTLAQSTCPRRVSLHGLMPSLHQEEKYSPTNVVATEILIDSTHMNRLLSIFKDIKSQLTNLEYIAQFNRDTLRTSAKNMARAYWENRETSLGAEYFPNALGPTLPSIQESDTDDASKTRVALQHLDVVLQRLAYSVRYLSTWRLTWIETQGQSPNKVFRNWLRRDVAKQDRASVLATISAQTEKSLEPLAVAFRLKTQPNPPISVENWTAHFPTQHLPVVAVRALDYLKGNFETYSILGSPGLQALLGDLSKQTILLDEILTKLKPAPAPVAGAAETPPVS